VQAVAPRVEALARELCENAASFTAEGGTILVRLETSLEWVIFEVRDEGPGIEPDDLPKVWDRFFTTRGQKRGTGLGLALVRAVCEAHGGRAEVRSEPGKGASFSVAFPRNSPPLN
jgi:signal transduction histidine kinase